MGMAKAFLAGTRSNVNLGNPDTDPMLVQIADGLHACAHALIALEARRG